MVRIGRDAKYKKVVDALYPKTQDAGINRHNIGNLLHYSMMTPNKLPKIGKYLERRGKTDLARRRIGFVEVTMTAFDELIKACYKDLPLFAPQVMDMMRELLLCPEPELKCIATRTFIEFADVQHGANRYDIEPFLNYFLSMASCDGKNDGKNLRVYGMRGLHAYITIVEDMDTFIQNSVVEPVAEYGEKKKSEQSSSSQTEKYVLPVVLGAMREHSDQGWPDLTSLDEHLENEWSEASMSALAALQLRELSSRVNNITIRPLFAGLLHYLGRENLWNPADFSKFCLRTMCSGMQRQHFHVLTTCLLQYLEVVDQNQTEVRACMVEALQQLVSLGNVGPVVEVLSAMLRQLLQTAGDKDKAKEKLQDRYLSCISTVIQNVQDSFQRLEALSYMIERYQDVMRTGSHSERRLHTKACVNVASQLKPLPATKSIPSGLIEMVNMAMEDQDHVVRECMQRVICLLFSVPGFLDRFAPSKTSMLPKGSNLLIPGPAKGLKPGPNDAVKGSCLLASSGEGILEKRVDEWHVAMVRHLSWPKVEPPNFLAVYETVVVLLDKLGPSELGYAVPYIFCIQDEAAPPNNDADVVDALHSEVRASLHVLAEALLTRIAHKFESDALAQYVKSVTSTWPKSCYRYLRVEENSVLVKKHSFKKKMKGFDVTPFKREEVLGCLAKTPSLRECEYVSA